MEEWEKELRKSMKKELPEKVYDLNSGSFDVHVSKQRFIDIEIAMQKEFRNLSKNQQKNGNLGKGIKGKT